MSEIIKLENISKSFNGRKILDKINLKIKNGEKFGIFGPSGCGKTTLLRIIAGLEKPDNGKVCLRGKEVTTDKIFIPPEKRNVSFIFQDLALWPHMSVKEHVEFVLNNKTRNLKKEVGRILKLVKLLHHADSKPEELSGGEKQRLAIARAIAQKSDILLLDEPFTSLDFKLKEEMKKLLLTLQKKYRITVIYVAHDMFEIIDICDRIAILNNGKIINVGPPLKLLKNQMSIFWKNLKKKRKRKRLLC